MSRIHLTFIHCRGSRISLFLNRFDTCTKIQFKTALALTLINNHSFHAEATIQPIQIKILAEEESPIN